MITVITTATDTTAVTVTVMPTITISVTIAIFLGLNGINVMPLIWFSGYNTAQTSTGFITQTVLSQISSVLSQFVQIFITLLAGEYLTRKTRPHLPNSGTGGM